MALNQSYTDFSKRKPVRIRNRSNYFIPEKDKAYITIGSAESFESKKIKIEGYESRLYWEYKYCAEHNGQTFFYTLTYSDKNIPKYFGHNVFDYKDLVWLLNGAFKKRLLRDYGTNFKYFVGAELGEGAGVRGYANNPHYHILFFLRSAEDDRYPYRKISVRDFQSIIRKYWQGFDEGEPFRHHKQYRFGIVKESDKGALVKDFNAISYVAKYVTKDTSLKLHERRVYAEWLKYYQSIYNYDNSEHLLRFVNDYNFRLSTELTPFSVPLHFYEYRGIMSSAMLKEFNLYTNKVVAEQVHLKMNEYRNRYCNKCRISQGVGDYALDFIEDELEPTIKIDTKKGPVNRPISQYYYRKLFTDVVKDPIGNPIRILNAKGIEYKKFNLSKRLKKLQDKTFANIQMITPEFLEKLKCSDLNINVTMFYDEYLSKLKELDVYETIKRYAEYKLVYEDRFSEVYADGPTGGVLFDDINIMDDFEWFIQPSYYQIAYDKFRSSRFLENGCKGYISYNSHPYFRCYMCLFDLFDLLSDYLFCSSDKQREQEDEERKRTRKLHIARKLQY